MNDQELFHPGDADHEPVTWLVAFAEMCQRSLVHGGVSRHKNKWGVRIWWKEKRYEVGVDAEEYDALQLASIGTNG